MYKAILNISIEVHEVNSSGECTGNTLDPDEIGVKNKFITDISGNSKNECLTKLKERINDLCSNK